MELFINYATLAALLALTMGIVLQIRKVVIRGNADTISVTEILLRFLASSMLVVKFIAVADLYLMLGQGIFTSSYLVYVILVLHTNRKNRRL